jgi:hypothetical protein
MVQIGSTLTDGELYLPFERAFERRFLRNNRWFLLLWMATTTAICLLGMWHSLKFDVHRLVEDYLAPILIGNAAVYGNLLFILRTLELARKRLPAVIHLLPVPLDQDNSRRSLIRRVYNPRRLWAWAIIVMLCGQLTFAILGINLPFTTTRIIFVAVIALIFGLLGTTVGLAVGFWAWMREFGGHYPTVDVFHPDKMGGLLPVADVSDWVISMGALLSVLYGLGAYFSPYAHAELKAYSYLWIAFATVLLALAFIVPAYSIHLCLVHARNEVAGKISKRNEIVFNMFQDGNLSNQSDIMALMWFSEALGKLNVWPYRQMAARFSGITALQFVPLLLNLYLTHVHR